MRDFIVQHEPHVIVVGASGLDSWQLKEDMKAVYDNLLDENAQFISDLEAGRIDIRCRTSHRCRARHQKQYY